MIMTILQIPKKKKFILNHHQLKYKQKKINYFIFFY